MLALHLCLQSWLLFCCVVLKLLVSLTSVPYLDPLLLQLINTTWLGKQGVFCMPVRLPVGNHALNDLSLRLS